jgi:RNA recognition motif-containing protein
MGGGHIGHDLAEKDELVRRVKTVQKSGQDGRSSWEKFCDEAQTGNRDPTKHSAQAMRIFLRAFERGDGPEKAARQLGRSSDGRVLRLRGIPFQCEVADIVNFMADFEPDESQVFIGRNSDGRASGEAFVVFRTPELADQALEQKQREEIDGRYIQLFKSSHEEKDAHTKAAPKVTSSGNEEKDELAARIKAIQRTDAPGKAVWEKYCDDMKTGSRDPLRHPFESLRNFLHAYDRGVAPQVGLTQGTCVLRFRGVPYQSDQQDVVDFLEAYNVDKSQVAMGYSKDLKSTGEAFALFNSVADGERALVERAKKEIRGRYIEIFRSSEEEMKMSTRAAIREGIDDPEAYEKEEMVAQVKRIQRSAESGKQAWYRYCDVSRTGNRDPLRHSLDSLRNFVRAHEAGETPEEAAERPVGDNRVVRLRGVPFQCDILDVVSFLNDYEVDETQVTIGRTESGRATGEALVVFNSPELANRALEEKQKTEIKGRYIELFRSSYEELDQVMKEAAKNSTGDVEKDELVARVKGIQRSSKEGREQWERFCASMSSGSHDPLRQTSDAMRTFLEAYHKGEMPQAIPAPGSRVVRLRGVPFQCAVSDVLQFLSEFRMDETQVLLGRQRDGKMSGEAYAVLPHIKAAEKVLEDYQRKEIRGRYIEIFRSCYEERDESNRNANAVLPVTGNIEKDDLVGRVKRIQRTNQDGKETWYEYCDQTGTGNRDPVRHTVDSLRIFVDAYERGEKPQAVAVGEKIANGRMRHRSSSR